MIFKLKPFKSILSDNFSDFTYLKKEHFLWFVKHKYDKRLFGRKVDPNNCPLKCYTDLIVFTFILQNIPLKSKILEIGGGNSRVLKYFKNNYECWNIDKLEGLGNGPKQLHPDQDGIRLVQDYIGCFNKKLHDNYFDFIFSISALEHTPTGNEDLFDGIIDDLQRVLKPGGYSLHCFDIVLKSSPEKKSWINPLLYRMFDLIDTYNEFIPLEQIENDDDVYVLSEERYNGYWQPITGREYKDYGFPTSYQVLWQK